MPLKTNYLEHFKLISLAWTLEEHSCTEQKEQICIQYFDFEVITLFCPFEMANGRAVPGVFFLLFPTEQLRLHDVLI